MNTYLLFLLLIYEFDVLYKGNNYDKCLMGNVYQYVWICWKQVLKCKLSFLFHNVNNQTVLTFNMLNVYILWILQKTIWLSVKGFPCNSRQWYSIMILSYWEQQVDARLPTAFVFWQSGATHVLDIWELFTPTALSNIK